MIARPKMGLGLLGPAAAQKACCSFSLADVVQLYAVYLQLYAVYLQVYAVFIRLNAKHGVMLLSPPERHCAK